jgi:hypothetical protein
LVRLSGDRPSRGEAIRRLVEIAPKVEKRKAKGWWFLGVLPLATALRTML